LVLGKTSSNVSLPQTFGPPLVGKELSHFVSGDVGPMLVDNPGETIEQDRLSDNGEEDEMIPKQA
jgi:hypothetical protein